MTARQGLRKSQPTTNTHSAPVPFDKMGLILKWKTVSERMRRDTDEKEYEITCPLQKGTFASVAAGGAEISPITLSSFFGNVVIVVVVSSSRSIFSTAPDALR